MPEKKLSHSQLIALNALDEKESQLQQTLACVRADKQKVIEEIAEGFAIPFDEITAGKWVLQNNCLFPVE